MSCLHVLLICLAVLDTGETERVMEMLKQYCDYGGLWGLLDPAASEKQGTTPAHFLTGYSSNDCDILSGRHFNLTFIYICDVLPMVYTNLILVFDSLTDIGN